MNVRNVASKKKNCIPPVPRYIPSILTLLLIVVALELPIVVGMLYAEGPGEVKLELGSKFSLGDNENLLDSPIELRKLYAPGPGERVLSREE